eukprot:sb/3464763/
MPRSTNNIHVLDLKPRTGFHTGTAAQLVAKVEGVEQDYLPVEWEVDGTKYLVTDPNMVINPENVKNVNVTQTRTTVGSTYTYMVATKCNQMYPIYTYTYMVTADISSEITKDGDQATTTLAIQLNSGNDEWTFTTRMETFTASSYSNGWVEVTLAGFHTGYTPGTVVFVIDSGTDIGETKTVDGVTYTYTADTGNMKYKISPSSSDTDDVKYKVKVTVGGHESEFEVDLLNYGVTGSKSLAMSGETVTMTCQVFGWDQSSVLDVTWTTSVNYQQVTYTDDNDLVEIVQGTVSNGVQVSTLTMSNPIATADQTYTCTFSKTADGTSRTATSTLDTFTKYVLSSPPPGANDRTQCEVQKGTTKKLTCTINGLADTSEFLKSNWVYGSGTYSMKDGDVSAIEQEPIRTCYSGHVTGYQPIRDQHFLIRSVPAIELSVMKDGHV